MAKKKEEHRVVNSFEENKELREKIYDDIFGDSDLTDKQKSALIKNLTNFTIEITSTNSFNEAQTTTGGIPLTEIDPKTMESLLVKNLYFTGEILDVDGICGGYNLGFAWISGILAGRSINKK